MRLEAVHETSPDDQAALAAFAKDDGDPRVRRAISKMIDRDAIVFASIVTCRSGARIVMSATVPRWLTSIVIGSNARPLAIARRSSCAIAARTARLLGASSLVMVLGAWCICSYVTVTRNYQSVTCN